MKRLTEKVIGKTKTNLKISFEIDLTRHGQERQTRKDNEGADIKEDEIVKLVNRLAKHIGIALVDDEVFINNRKSQLLLKDRREGIPTENLNVVISVEGDFDDTTLKVVTVMRKKDFKQSMKSNIIQINKDGSVIHKNG